MERKRKQGFTLLEVIIALGLLGLGLASILQAFPGAVRSSVRVEYNSRAPLLAQQIIETITADIQNLGQHLPINHDPGLHRGHRVLVPRPPFRLPAVIEDRNGDGRIDHNDVEWVVYPPLPVALPEPNDDMYYQILSRRVVFTTDEDQLDTVADANQLIFPNLLQVIVRVCWYPTGKLYNPSGKDPVDGIDNDNDGVVDGDLPFDYVLDVRTLIMVDESVFYSQGGTT